MTLIILSGLVLTFLLFGNPSLGNISQLNQSSLDSQTLTQDRAYTVSANISA